MTIPDYEMLMLLQDSLIEPVLRHPEAGVFHFLVAARLGKMVNVKAGADALK
jgi:hypothetical protein